MHLSRSTSKLSSIKLSTQAKTNWPVPTVIQIFLPQFKLVSQSTVEKDYRINGVIARGAFGKVYRAEKIDEHQIYAIKILSKAQVQIFKEKLRFFPFCSFFFVFIGKQ